MYRGHVVPRPRSRPDLVALALALASVLWLAPALWPDAQLPAWPGASLAVLALALARRPGAPVVRASATILASLGLLGALAQIAALAGVAWLARTGQ